MAKSSYFSEPVRASVDELMTELLRRIPESELADILRNACYNAEHREQHDRHMRYKCQRFFRRLALRLAKLPPDLAVTVGIEKPGAHISLPDMSAEPANEYEEALVRMALEDVQQEAAEEEEEEMDADAAPESDDDLWEHLDIPEFDDFKDVFQRYPYAQMMSRPGYGRLLVLGYASGRHRQSNALIRRNLAVNEQPFNKIVSILGLFKRKEGNVHQHIKVVKYRPGMVVRAWTNVQGEGDRADLYRYLVCQQSDIEPVSQAEYNAVLDRWEQLNLGFGDVA